MHSVRRTAFSVFAVMFLVGAVISAQAVEEPITLSSIMSNRTISSTVESARLRYETALIAATSAGVGTDPGFTVSPTTKLSGDEGDTDPQKATLTASFGLTVPLGLNTDQRARAISAIESLEIAAAALSEAELQEIRDVVRLYQLAYLAQREREVGQLELEAARLHLQSERARFEQGDLRFSDFLRSENEFSETEAEAAVAGATLREAVLNLSTATGIDLDPDRPFAPPPRLYDPKDGAEHADGEDGAEHADGADGEDGAEHAHGADGDGGTSQWFNGEHHSSAADYLDAVLMSRHFAVQEAEREAATRPSFLSFTQARASLDYLDHSASASFNPASRLLGLSYTPEGIVLRDDLPSGSTGSGGSGSSDSDWSLSISVSFALSPSRVETYDHQAAQLAVEQARLALADEQLRAADEKREAELELLKAAEAVQSLAAAVERAEINLAMVRAREVVQQTRPADVRAAEAALERALLSLERAELLRDQKFLELVVPSSDALRILSLPATWRIE